MATISRLNDRQEPEATGLPTDYTERVYAGVLGKIIGVYLGRPFEGWRYEHIMEKLGEINYYVHDRLGVPLVVTDDDISGTFTFLRALPDYGNSADLTPQQIAETWLNYIIEQRTILWWGGLGVSTEHTAYLRLKAGIPAPQSGSIALNGPVVAEQIGAQIFIDGWGMVAPGRPELAAQLAHKAGSVSHDGESVYAAQVIAAMEAAAFVEHNIQKLLDIGLSVIPANSLIAQLINDIRNWHKQESDWRKARELVAQHYGYDTYGGGCHVIPNHALIILALLYGDDDFQKSLMIVNTCGWDTDCNSGNVGCLLGIKNGLQSLEGGPDWRGPVADRLYLPTADGGRTISDALTEAYHVAASGYALAGQQLQTPKSGARFHFSLPGSVQNFQVLPQAITTGQVTLRNTDHPLQAGQRALAIGYTGLAEGQAVRVSTATFMPEEAINMTNYSIYASPTLYPGQNVRAAVYGNAHNTAPVKTQLFIRVYNHEQKLETIAGPDISLAPSEAQTLTWRIPETGGNPIAEIGLAVWSESTDQGNLYLDWLTWDGEPNTHLQRPTNGGTMYGRAWVNAVDSLETWGQHAYNLTQNAGTGLIIQGTREWHDYRVLATVTPHLAQAVGIAARVQGMRRYYALLLTSAGQAQLVKVLDGTKTILAQREHTWHLYQPVALALQVEGNTLQATVADQIVFTIEDTEAPLTSGALALLINEGRAGFDNVSVQPVQK